MANIDNAFRVERLSFNDNVLVTEGSSNPAAGAGYEAPVGSLYVQSGTGNVYVKFDVADTDWRLFSGIDSQNIAEVTGEPTGHLNRIDSEISFNDGSLTFTIQPLLPATSFDYYIKGVKYTINTTKTITIPDTTATYFIYLDTNKNLQYQTTFDVTLMTSKAYTCAIYWNDVTNKAIYVADERHGITMDGATHSYLHISFGTQYIDGLGLLNMVVGEQPPTDAATQFAVYNGTIRDEDLSHDIYDTGGLINVYDLEQEINPLAYIPILYRTGTAGDWNIKNANTFPLIESGQEGYTGANGLPAWNEWTGTTWQLTQVPNNRFFFVHYVATNDIRHPIMGILGIGVYQNKPQGQREALDELKIVVGLPFQEFCPIASVIFEVANSFSNTVKARIAATGTGDDYIDWRTLSHLASGGVSGSTVTLQQAYDNSSTPEFITDTIRGAISIREGAGVGGNLIEASDETNTLNFAIATNGDIFTNGLVDGRDINTDGIALDNLGIEVNSIESSLGTSVLSTGVWNGFTGTNYLNAATSITNALALLDAEFFSANVEKTLLLHNGAVTQTFINPTTLLFGTSVRTDAAYTYSAGVVTINTTGWYEITFDVSYTTTANSRTISETLIQVNGVAVPGSYAYGYHRTIVEGHQTTTATIKANLTATNTVRVVGRTFAGGNSIQTLANACRLNIRSI